MYVLYIENHTNPESIELKQITFAFMASLESPNNWTTYFCNCITYLNNKKFKHIFFYREAQSTNKLQEAAQSNKLAASEPAQNLPLQSTNQQCPDDSIRRISRDVDDILSK